jgi:putative tryptophan/tyrosine transport system substrate-binding protein
MIHRRSLMRVAAAGALAAPLAGLAQTVATPARIGWISITDPGISLDEFRGGLRKLGYVGARELQVDFRLALRDAQSVSAVVEELLKIPVALIVTVTVAAPFVHRAVAGRVPVVFAFSGDPVEAGLVQSLARPGGNTTGMSFLALDLVGKRLEVLKEIVPKMKRVAILANPQHAGEKAERRESLIAAERLGLQAAYVEFNQAQGFDAALDNVRQQGCEGLVVFPDVGMLGRAQQIAGFAMKERMPCISGWAEFAHAGCLVSYGPNLRDGYHRLAHYADRILKGAHPSSLPVEQPARVDLVVNLKTARALGVTIPNSLLLRADEVIQ